MKRIVLLLYLFLLSIFDWREKKVPVVLLATGVAAAGLYGLYGCLQETGAVIRSVAELCFGMLPGIGVLFLAWLTQKIGYGDGIVLLTVGLLLGGKVCAVLLSFSILLAAVVSILLLVLHRVKRNTSMPYLPFLTVTYLAGLLI